MNNISEGMKYLKKHNLCGIFREEKCQFRIGKILCSINIVSIQEGTNTKA